MRIAPKQARDLQVSQVGKLRKRVVRGCAQGLQFLRQGRLRDPGETQLRLGEVRAHHSNDCPRKQTHSSYPKGQQHAANACL